MSVLVISSLEKNKDNTTVVEFKIDIAQFIDLTDREFIPFIYITR